MYTRAFVLLVLITSVLGKSPNFPKRDDCNACNSVESYSDQCFSKNDNNPYDCLCSDDKFWSYYASCLSCANEEVTIGSSLRSEYCYYATDPYFQSLLTGSYSDDMFDSYTDLGYPSGSYDYSALSGDSMASLTVASSTVDEGSSSTDTASGTESTITKESGTMSRSTTTEKSKSDTKTNGGSDNGSSSTEKNGSSSSKTTGGSENDTTSTDKNGSSSSKTSSSSSSGSSDSSSTSNVGNSIFVSKLTIGSLIAYVLLML